MAEEVLDSVQSIGVWDEGTPRKTVLKIFFPLDERASQSTAQKIEEFMRFNSAVNKVRTGD